MHKFSVVMSIVLSLCMAAAVDAQVRGRGRLTGIVTDKVTGQPVAGAKITVALATEQTAPIITNTDSKGRWTALGLTNGLWNIDIVANGYETTRGSANVSEMQMSPPIKTQLAPAPKEEAAAATASPLIPKEGVALIDEGQDLLKVKAGDVVTSTQATGAGASTAVSHTVTSDEVKENAKKAVADFEKAIPLIPADKPEAASVRMQLMQVMAQAYYRAGDLPKAISTLEQVNAMDAANTDAAAITGRDLLLVNLYLEHSDLDKAKALLDKLPEGSITDPTIYTNIGILFLNKQNPTDAASYFTKAVNLDTKRAESYYYRGLAETQLRKTAEAKADFQQVLTLAPDSPEAKDAKQMLDALAKTK